MSPERLIIKQIKDISPIVTSHGTGKKIVFVSNGETVSKITQISYTTLQEGEKAEIHSHTDMDEHYLFLKGRGKMAIDGENYECLPGTFILLPAKSQHALAAETRLEFIVISVAL